MLDSSINRAASLHGVSILRVVIRVAVKCQFVFAGWRRAKADCLARPASRVGLQARCPCERLVVASRAFACSNHASTQYQYQLLGMMVWQVYMCYICHASCVTVGRFK